MVNLPALLFQHLRDNVKETKEGRKKIRNWIPLERLILDILMESKTIDSLIEDQITKGLEPLVGKVLNAKCIKNMIIISELISPPTEIPKEFLYNRRITLEDFPIFSNPDPLNVVIWFLENYHACEISKTTYNKKRKISKKHH